MRSASRALIPGENTTSGVVQLARSWRRHVQRLNKSQPRNRMTRGAEKELTGCQIIFPESFEPAVGYGLDFKSLTFCA
jgi:hypothetical protein